MGKFWIEDDFIRKYARSLDIYTQMVYVALCCYANKEGETFVGVRTIAKNLGINKDTVAVKIKELKASGLVGQLKNSRGRVSVLKLTTVPSEAPKVSDPVRPKEVFKEEIKECSKIGLKERFPDLYKKLYKN